MVNLPIQNTNLQAQAIIAAEGSGVAISSDKDLESISTKKEVKKVDWMKQLLEVGGSKDLTTQLLKDLMTKVAQAGIIFEGIRPRSEVKESPEFKKDGSPEEFTDRVSVSLKSNGEDNFAIPSIGKKAVQLREEIAQKWEEIKEKLIKEGKSEAEISQIELQFKSSEAQKHWLNLLKESAILYYLDSDNKFRQMIRRRGFADLLDKVEMGLGKEAVAKAQDEVQNFVLEELENQLIKRTFLQDGDFKECYKLVRIGEKVGIDSLTWMEHLWPERKLHHGLNFLDLPHEVTGYVNLKDTDAQSQQQKAKYEFKDEDEKDLLLNRLRALYLQLILRPGAINSLASWFKVRKLKNGLIRLGVYTKDLDEKTHQEAKTLAKVKTMEMLEEAFHERATFFDEGPAKELVESKIKNCLKNLERLGFNLESKDFVALRDKANRQMYELVQKEQEITQEQKGPMVEKKIKLLQKLISRLQEETDLGVKEEA